MVEALFRVWRIGRPMHGGIQETGFRARDEAPSLAYPVHQVRSRIGMAAQDWTDSERRVRILTKVRQKKAWSPAKGLFVSPSPPIHDSRAGFYPPSPPRRLTSTPHLEEMV